MPMLKRSAKAALAALWLAGYSAIRFGAQDRAVGSISSVRFEDICFVVVVLFSFLRRHLCLLQQNCLSVQGRHGFGSRTRLIGIFDSKVQLAPCLRRQRLLWTVVVSSGRPRVWFSK